MSETHNRLYILKESHPVDAILRLSDEQKMQLQELLKGIKGLEHCDPDVIALVTEPQEAGTACGCQGKVIGVDRKI